MTKTFVSLVLVSAVLVASSSCSKSPRPKPTTRVVTAPPAPAPPVADPVEVVPERADAPVSEPLPAIPEAPPSPVVAARPLSGAGPDQVVGPDLLRVGLLTDVESFDMACCAGGLTDGGGRVFATADAAVRVQPRRAAGAAAPRGAYRLQVAALRESSAATALAKRMAVSLGLPADSRFDAAAGLYKVWVGRYLTRADAETAQRRLTLKGINGSWIVQDGPGLEDPRLTVTVGTRRHEVTGRWLAIAPAGQGVGISVAGTRYRGRVLVYLNDRGTLNVINELPLEAYLRGVVPKEMGPGLYPELAALEAQAVAARTYTLRNLGDFELEGFDICATPRCQVYGGMASEHPLSDRAVAETAGQVMLHVGQPIDAMFTAVCGGHTEDVRTVFPLKAAEPYLVGVPCLEAGAQRVTAGAAGQPWPGGVFGDEVAGSGLLVEEAQLVGVDGQALEIRGIGNVARRRGTVGEEVLLFRGNPRDPALASTATLDLVPGEPLQLLWRGSQLLAAAVTSRAVALSIPAYARRYQSWSRFRTASEVDAAVRTRYPGFALRDFEVLERGVSGRVARLRLDGANDSSVIIEGLDVRWTLDIPDTWFEVTRDAQQGRSGWRFSGRGWGHGVGMCQIGSYGLARRGVGYRDILRHYYRDVVFGRVVTAAEAAATGG